MDGVYQQKDSYIVNGTTLTFDAAPANNAEIEVMSFAQTTINQPGTNTVSVAELNLSDGTSGQAIVTDGNGTISFADVGIDGIVSSANATAITIDSSENVGIGTTNPNEKLSVLGGHVSVGDSTGVSGTEFLLEGYREIYLGAKYGNTSIRTTYNTGSNASDMLFYTASGGTTTTEAMRIDSSGNVGIGTISPAVSLDLGSRIDAIDIPSGTTAQRPSSPSNGMIRYNTTENEVEGYVNGGWTSLGTRFVATGGTVVSSGGYKYHTFTSSGTFTVSAGTQTVDFLVVAGGGGAGSRHGGGGGAGGYQTGSYTAAIGNYTVTIGAGGVGAVKDTTGAAAGGNSSVFGTTSTGGGLGAGYTITTTSGSGGSGGGAPNLGGSNYTGGSGTAGQGNDGGDVTSGGGEWAGAGGGGATAAGGGSTGGTGVSGGNGGTGSNSVATWATATSTGDSGYYAGGGGGGGSHTNGSGGSGGSGGGGDGAALLEGNGVDGTVNTGGGGGGSRDYNGGAGGSGIVIIRYAE
jgi:hypothetical protein